MDVKNLQFFDRDGYNMNFTWDDIYGCWVGNVYLPKVSVGLYANTDIYVMEEVDGVLCFPMSSTGEVITFEWDKLNKFVDEFFMFTFDDSYVQRDLSALTYIEQDGPDAEVLHIEKYGAYEIELPSSKMNKVLPLHVAFSAAPQFDATTYSRALIMKCGYNNPIARITFYAETVDEDERLKIWNANLGYNITSEDATIFKKSNIHEPFPDYQLLNEKRKELMMEGHNIYPYVGSYKALINAIKFFGYENLNIVEYWKNVNEDDSNYLKEFQSSKYSLTNVETLSLGGVKIPLPNRNFKKTDKISLVYSINSPVDGQYDEMELPLVREHFTYTIEEALIKLFALRKKLNKEFMPAGKRIFEIIGEGNYFGLNCLANGAPRFSKMDWVRNKKPINFTAYPSDTVYITNDYDFKEYIYDSINLDSDSDVIYGYQCVSDINFESVVFDRNIESMEDVSIENVGAIGPETMSVPNYDLSELYANFYDIAHNVNGTSSYVEMSNSNGKDKSSVYDDLSCSAKIVLTNDSFDEVFFNDVNIRFDDIDNNPNAAYAQDGSESEMEIRDIEFERIDYHDYDTIEWMVEFSADQVDEEDKNLGVDTVYPTPANPYRKVISGDIDKTSKIYLELPHIGYYDVTIKISNNNGTSSSSDDKSIERTIKKGIKVEPYHIDVRGFYYDARNLPETMEYEADDDLKEFVEDNLKSMTAWAVQEHIVKDDAGATMINYTPEGKINVPGPYFVRSMNQYWYLFDHVNYDIAKMIPSFDYARYIKSGVDVRPYTWFLLGYDNTKITGKMNPKWTLKREDGLGVEVEHEGRYLTYLLKETGNYVVTLELTDINGNKYSIERNIFVVADDADYKLYDTFRRDYLSDYNLNDSLRDMTSDYMSNI